MTACMYHHEYVFVYVFVLSSYACTSVCMPVSAYLCVCESALSASWQQANVEPRSSFLSVHRQGPVALGYRVSRGWMDSLASPKCQLGMWAFCILISCSLFLSILPLMLYLEKPVNLFTFL